jgi:hypothetical protein
VPHPDRRPHDRGEMTADQKIVERTGLPLANPGSVEIDGKLHAIPEPEPELDAHEAFSVNIQSQPTNSDAFDLEPSADELTRCRRVTQICDQLGAPECAGPFALEGLSPKEAFDRLMERKLATAPPVSDAQVAAAMAKLHGPTTTALSATSGQAPATREQIVSACHRFGQADMIEPYLESRMSLASIVDELQTEKEDRAAASQQLRHAFGV